MAHLQHLEHTSIRLVGSALQLTSLSVFTSVDPRLNNSFIIHEGEAGDTDQARGIKHLTQNAAKVWESAFA